MSRNQLYCSWRVYLWTVERRRRRRKREKIHIDIHIVGPRIQTEHTHEVRMYLFVLHSLVVMSTVRFLLFLGKIYCSSFNPPHPHFSIACFHCLVLRHSNRRILRSSELNETKKKNESRRWRSICDTRRSARKYETTKMIIISWYGILLEKIAWRRTTKLEFFFFLFRSFARHTARTHTNVHEKFKRLKRIGCTVFSFLCGYNNIWSPEPWK